MSMSVTYTPGYGYAGYLPGSDKPVIRYGKEFVESMMELAKQKQQEAQSTNNPTESFTRRKLTRGEFTKLTTELAAKYDPSNMTQEEYDSLLDDLVKEGILSKDELGPMGYHGMVVCGTLADTADFARGTGGTLSVDTATLHSNPFYQRYGLALSLYDTKGNALAYAKLMALLKPTSGITAGWLTFAEKRQSSFQALADVLEAMQK